MERAQEANAPGGASRTPDDRADACRGPQQRIPRYRGLTSSPRRPVHAAAGVEAPVAACSGICLPNQLPQSGAHLEPDVEALAAAAALSSRHECNHALVGGLARRHRCDARMACPTSSSMRTTSSNCWSSTLPMNRWSRSPSPMTSICAPTPGQGSGWASRCRRGAVTVECEAAPALKRRRRLRGECSLRSESLSPSPARGFTCRTWCVPRRPRSAG